MKDLRDSEKHEMRGIRFSPFLTKEGVCLSFLPLPHSRVSQ